MKRSKFGITPSGYMDLSHALHLCRATWNCEAAEAWHRLGSVVCEKTVRSMEMDQDGERLWDHGSWGSAHNDDAWLTEGLIYVVAGFKYDRDGYVNEEDLRAWLSGKEIPQSQTATIKKNPGGRPVIYDWDGMWIEIICIIHRDGIPETSLKLKKRMKQWFEDRGGSPSDNTIEPKIQRFWKRFHRD